MRNAIKTYPADFLTQIETYHQGLIDRGEEEKFDPRRFVEAHCKIEDTGGNVINLIHNKSQIKFHDAWCEAEEKTGIFWALIGKSRQHGFSTISDVGILVRCYHRPNTTAAIIAHRWDSTRWLFGKCDFAYRHFPEDIRAARPLTSPMPTQFEIKFAFPHNSQLICQTAGNKTDFGHGFTLQMVHLSEAARFQNAVALMTGVGNANHYVPGSVRIVESTGEGRDPWFHPRCLEALKLNSPSQYQWFFFGLKDYDRKFYQVPPGWKGRDDVRPDEQEFIEEHELDQDQADFMIWKKREDCGDQWPVFKQQFPVTPEMMFESTGYAYFDINALNEIAELHVRPPIAKGDLRFDSPEIGSTISLDEKARNPLFLIYEMPDPDAHYILTMDCAEGVRGDYTIIAIYKIIQPSIVNRAFGLVTNSPLHGYKLEQVATYATNRVAIDLSSVDAFMFGHYYHQAYACIENNNHGLLVLKYFENGHNLRDFPQAFVPYPSIYYPVTQSTREEEEINRLGWQTGKTTKPILINTCAQWIREKRYIIHCQRTIDELMGFYWDPERKVFTQKHKHADAEDYHDDEVIATALAPQALQSWLSRPRLMEKLKIWVP